MITSLSSPSHEPTKGAFAADEIILALPGGIVVWIEHIAPDVNRLAGVFLADHLRTALDVLGEHLPAGLACLATRRVPSDVANLVVQHHVTVRLHHSMAGMEIATHDRPRLRFVPAGKDAVAVGVHRMAVRGQTRCPGLRRLPEGTAT